MKGVERTGRSEEEKGTGRELELEGNWNWKGTGRELEGN